MNDSLTVFLVGTAIILFLILCLPVRRRDLIEPIEIDPLTRALAVYCGVARRRFPNDPDAAARYIADLLVKWSHMPHDPDGGPL